MKEWRDLHTKEHRRRQRRMAVMQKEVQPRGKATKASVTPYDQSVVEMHE